MHRTQREQIQATNIVKNIEQKEDFDRVFRLAQRDKGVLKPGKVEVNEQMREMQTVRNWVTRTSLGTTYESEVVKKKQQERIRSVLNRSTDWA